MRKAALLVVAVSLALVGLMYTSAGAVPVAGFAFKITATLNGGFPCSPACTGTSNGKAYGGGVDSVTHKAVTCAGCKTTATFTYNEPFGQCQHGVPIAPLGTASGTLNLFAKPSTVSGHFSWTRVGVNAVLIFSNPTGVGTAAFVPPHACHFTTASIAGVAIVG